MAPIPLTNEQYQKLVKYIANLRGVVAPAARQDFLINCGLQRFVGRINFDTTADTFAQSLVRTLQDFGTLPDTKKPALVNVLKVMLDEFGGNEEIVNFIQDIGGNFLEQAATPPTPTPSPVDPPPPPSDKIRILFLAANPVNTPSLRLGAEAREIDLRLQQGKMRDRFDLIQAGAVQWRDMPALLMRYEPDIVHFSGHGAQSGELMFEDGQGMALPVSPDTLSDLFEILNDNVRCVVLNACWSETQAAAIVKNIDCVIGMQRSVADEGAIEFSSGFYLAIGNARSIKRAFGIGRVQVQGYIRAEADNPQLKSRDGVDPDKIVFQ